MRAIKYEMTWCDYLTPCPYMNKDKSLDGIMVGSWECSQCKFYNSRSNTVKDKIVYCSYKSKL